MFVRLFFFKTSSPDFFNSIGNLVKIPPLWGIFVKCILDVFGFSYKIFRLYPFISGILSLFAFFILLKRILKSKIAIITGLLIFTFNFWLIYYSADFRPYSNDVLVTVILILLYKYFHLKNINWKKTFVYTILSCFFVLYSFPAIFIIPSMVISKSIEEKYFDFKSLFIFTGILICCIYLYYIDKNTYEFMLSYWNSVEYGFIKLNFNSVCNIFTENFKYLFNLHNLANIKLKEYLLLSVFIIGLIIFNKENHKEKLLFLLIFLFSIIASMLNIYPFANRHILYLLPIVIIYYASIIDYNLPLNSKLFSNIKKLQTNEKFKNIFLFCSSCIISCLILIFININLWGSLNFNPDDTYCTFYKVPERKTLENQMKSILNNYKENDKLVLNDEIMVTAEFYNYYFNFNKNLTYEIYPNSLNQLGEFIENILKNKKNNSSIYFVAKKNSFSYVPEAELIEAEIKKQNIKYSEYIDDYIYNFKF